MAQTPSWPPTDACEAVSPDDAYATGATGLSTPQDTPDTAAADAGKAVVAPIAPAPGPDNKPGV